MLFQLVQLIYWLALSTWFGGVLFIALSAPVIFKTVRDNNPILSHVLSVNLEGQHSTLLAGNIVFSLIQRLRVVELVCSPLLLIALGSHPFILQLKGNNLNAAIIRSALYLATDAVMLYDWQFIWPRMRGSRDLYLEHADEPQIANPALDRYDREQRLILTLTILRVALLLGIILFSTNLGDFVVTTSSL